MCLLRRMTGGVVGPLTWEEDVGGSSDVGIHDLTPLGTMSQCVATNL